jgi:hypothetical protein
MRLLEARLQKIECELAKDEPVVTDPETEARRLALVEAMAALAETMSPEHWQMVYEDLNAKAAGTISRFSDLTMTFLTRAARYVKRDARPLTRPPELCGGEVASLQIVYIENWREQKAS